MIQCFFKHNFRLQQLSRSVRYIFSLCLFLGQNNVISVTTSKDLCQPKCSIFLMPNKNVILWTESFGNQKDSACLLISGAGSPAQFWTNKFCSYFSKKDYFVIRYDHRDQGMSSSIDFEKSPYTVKDLVDDAVKILKGYNIKKAHVIGHSMGGIIAQLLAIYYPERVLSITSACVAIGDVGVVSPPKEVMNVLLENKPIQNFNKDLPGFMRSWEILNGDIAVDEEMAIAYTKDLYDRSYSSVGVAWNHIKAQQNLENIAENLKKIAVSTLFIAGEKDVMMPPGLVSLNAKLIPKSKFVVIPNMGHMFFDRKIEKQIAHIILNHIA
jgi:pimeloyl-ACP methyl ester carboxylesterase